ncbi:hypothetical protein TIFTF001_029333 [Ficus carica]|uniref:Uncharacterized protein n=1 Tax=Ficus carica TaxID=3494 RepID=A0AA88DRQ4_FICCA|nr:hypothetical protein TIFTF001_029333 [Ficus carica]
MATLLKLPDSLGLILILRVSRYGEVVYDQVYPSFDLVAKHLFGALDAGLVKAFHGYRD